MPNHCDNDLRIKGKSADIQKFFEFALNKKKDKDVKAVEDKIGIRDRRYGEIDVNAFIPYPKKYADVDAQAEEARKNPNADWSKIKDGYNHGGYDWCIENWGTKWGLYDFSPVKEFKSSAVVSFQTAWSPALPVIQKMSEMFPELSFTLKYFECGGGFKGVYECKAGKVLKNETSKYKGNRGG